MTALTENRTEATARTVSELNVRDHLSRIKIAKTDSPAFETIAHLLRGCRNHRPNRAQRLKRT